VRVREAKPDVDVVVFTAYAGAEGAIEAIKRGAYDYLAKPLDLDQVEDVIRRCTAERCKEREAPPTEGLASPSHVLVGRHPVMLRVFKTIGAVAESRASVLIRGETGTGKELVARTIHENSARPDAPFIAMNCASVPENLLESELFGHVRGAFTGATSDRRGRFELAANGTLFLDEIGDTSLAFQAKLLRALQEHQFYPVGSEEPRTSRARVIAATHRPLEELIAEGRFREDLYFRLQVVEIRVPPLRERRSDIPVLVRHILSRSAADVGRPVPAVPPDLMAHLINREWTGNVRELQNVLTRAVVMARGPVLTPQDLAGSWGDEPAAAARTGTYDDDDFRPAPDEGPREADSLEAVARMHVQKVLLRTGGNKAAAARILQVSRPTVHRMVKDYELYAP
jgi:DNA-binding NtrC family response regulator